VVATALTSGAYQAPAPYPPGALSRFLAWIDRLPWHGWWFYPALALALLAWSQGLLWATGQLPFGTFDKFLTAGVFYGPYVFAALALINQAAERALVSFWPATGWPIEDREAWRYAFVTSPRGLTGIAIAVGVAGALATFYSATDLFADGTGRGITLAAYLPSAVLGYSLVVLAIAHTTRQLRLVARIHREATAIDPFDRVPLYAFSSMTARTGLAYVVTAYYAITVNGAVQASVVVVLVPAVVFVFGMLCFVLPLWGIHVRLGHEKELLLRDLDGRVSRLGLEMYRRVDAGEFDTTNAITDGLAGLQTLRERIVRLPTWPWPPQLFRGFISALLVPVVVYLASRIIGGQLGA